MAHSTSVLAHFGILATFRNSAFSWVAKIMKFVLELFEMVALKNATYSYKSGTQGEFVLVFNFRHTFAWNLGEISKVSWLIFTPMQT